MADSWIDLMVTYDMLEAEIIKDLLESGGIDVVIRSAKVSPYPVNVGKMGEVIIIVRKEDRERAEAVVRDYRTQEENI